MSDKELLLERLERLAIVLDTIMPGCDELVRDAITMLKEQEVKTGHWIDSAGNDKCSNCGTEYSDLYPDYGNTHFCPNCGAKMEKKNKEA